MFLNKKYILANELVQKMDIHIANISMLAKQFEDSDSDAIVKMNNCTFINTKAIALPNNIKMGIVTNEFTDMSNKLPCTFVRTEYGLSEKDLVKLNVLVGKEKIAGKDFFVFNDDFVKLMKYKIAYVLDEADTMDCASKGQIEGYMQISKNKFFTWY